VIRDYGRWIHPDILLRVEKNKDDKFQDLKERPRREKQDPNIVSRPEQAGLCVAMYAPSSSATASDPVRDLVFFSGLVTAILQLAIAAVPIGIFRRLEYHNDYCLRYHTLFRYR
jgi:hypothetical protein